MENKDLPAFPEVFTNPKTDEYHRVYSDVKSRLGLTKREYFAGLAMNGIIANQSSLSILLDKSTERPEIIIARAATLYADALLNQLNNQ